MTDGKHIAQEDLALYAMQALSEAEQAAAREHVAQCSVCRGELAQLQGDLALVALSTERHELPAGAGERLMARVAAEPQNAGDRKSDKSVSIESAKPARKIYASISWSAAAALFIFSLGMLMKVGSLNVDLRRAEEQLSAQQQASARAERVLEVLTAENAQHATLTAAQAHPQPDGRAVYLASTGGLIFQASHLQALPAGKTYELWVIPANGKAPIPAGLFQPDAAGSASVILPRLSPGVPAKAFGVTMEAAGGSTTPTAPILLAGAAGE
jgi:Anti-sigma-K factor rskA, C-terminal/Putative zinc-finger